MRFTSSPATTLLPSAPSPNVISTFALAFTSVLTSVFIFALSTFAFTTTELSVSPLIDTSAFASTITDATLPSATTVTLASFVPIETLELSAPFATINLNPLSVMLILLFSVYLLLHF